MNTPTIVLALLVALEHLYIMYLETWATDSEATSRVFSIPRPTLGGKPVSTLLKNQGVYNGLLALMIVIAVWQGDLFWTRMLLGYVVLAAAYGSLTSNPLIILKQGGLAMAALVCTML